ncbi:hypothetical protein FMEAI12_4970009 [Parafrankia sp. Ea1.12]|nr:hypothetical protein FMEAI12_4970009 [Parafrankia sp. Ea1.12]
MADARTLSAPTRARGAPSGVVPARLQGLRRLGELVCLGQALAGEGRGLSVVLGWLLAA